MSEIMTSCVAVVGDCADCVKDPYRQHAGLCDDMCHLRHDQLANAEFHAAWHRAERCRRCGEYCRGREATALCRAELCTVWSCPACGEERGSAGPIDCPACNKVGFFGRVVGWLADVAWRLRGVHR